MILILLYVHHFSDINSVAHIVETLRSRIDLSIILDLNAYTTRSDQLYWLLVLTVSNSFTCFDCRSISDIPVPHSHSKTGSHHLDDVSKKSIPVKLINFAVQLDTLLKSKALHESEVAKVCVCWLCVCYIVQGVHTVTFETLGDVIEEKIDDWLQVSPAALSLTLS